MNGVKLMLTLQDGKSMDRTDASKHKLNPTFLTLNRQTNQPNELVMK